MAGRLSGKLHSACDAFVFVVTPHPFSLILIVFVCCGCRMRFVRLDEKRDEEVNWDYVRCLPNGECISVTGTHLGHNLPDGKGNRYCINLVSVAGLPEEE